MICFPRARVDITPALVTVTFPDGAKTTCEVEAGNNDWYRTVAAKCGYDDFRRYARHHDLVHCWLAAWKDGGASPALFAVAHGDDEHDSDAEEHLVNTVQWAIATDNWSYHADYFAREIGPHWQDALERLRDLLGGIR